MNRPFLSVALAAMTTLPASIAASAPLGPPPQPNAAGILNRIQGLDAAATVLYVAAHPDDENTTLLAYLAQQRHLRAVYLSVTRGDGGQNLIGSEQGDRLGVIRTQELLAARRVDGAEQAFTRAVDFGYSKTPDETFAIWNHDEVLADVVWAIRRLRPDVVVARFSTEHDAGQHGHHTASARLAGEAFSQAADPKFLPAQVALVGAHKARRLLWNRSTWNAKPEDKFEGFMKLDIGGFHPLLGVSFGELAARSRSMHKSQGFGAAENRGPITEYFKTLDGDAPPVAGDPLAGIDTSLGRFPGTSKLREAIARAAQGFNANAPAASIPALLEVEKLAGAIPDAAWRERKVAEVRELVAACAGLHLDVTAADPTVVPGGTLKLVATAMNRSRAAVKLVEVRFADGTANVGKALETGKALPTERAVNVDARAAWTTPYWLAEKRTEALHRVSSPDLLGLPEAPPTFHATFVVEVGGQRLSFERGVTYKWTDPVAGERRRRVEVVPAVSVTPDATVLPFPGGGAQTLRVSLHAYAAKQSGAVRLEAPAGYRVAPDQAPFDLGDVGAEAEVAFTITPPASAARTAGHLTVVAEVGGARFTQAVSAIDHAHIPVQVLQTPAEVELVPFTLRRGGSRVGYIPGAGDEVVSSLRRVGYDVTVLDEPTLRDAKLGGFDAVVVGVRAYNTNDWMRGHQKKLLDYVAAGGTLVVQYNTANRISKLSAAMGPYPFEIARGRVTVQTAPVTLLAPKHRALTTPNAITAADFEGWVQERGLYFAKTWDAKYETPLAMNDPGEPVEQGSLLVARHGKGAFVYTGLAFFRQLPAGVPGAYRLFANLLALSSKQAK